MVFSSLAFLLMFLPAVVAVYYICPKKIRNYWLPAASLFFYGYGEPVLVRLLIVEILWDYFWGLALGVVARRRLRTFLLVICVAGNLGVLVWFKCAGFLAGVLSNLSGVGIDIPEIALPIGISFYTFQGISYVVDVWRGDARTQENPFKLGLYISLFPQLIAGPIIRYKDIQNRLMIAERVLMVLSAGFSAFAPACARRCLLPTNLG